MKQDEILCIRNLSVQLSTASLFDALSLQLNRRDKLTITGPSGSGKSTLLRCILGFVPFAGEISVQGVAVNGRKIWGLRPQLAYVAQEPELGEGRVREILMRPFSFQANQHLRFCEEEASQLLERFNLSDSFLDQEITSLSGGEKQRIALIAALLLKRPILLLDEAASALDATTKLLIRDYLADQKDLAILSVSHDIHHFVFDNPIYRLADGSLKREQQ
ncbi:MAG: ATP-binding cassette domain-containing protein [Candidatus Hydrogenedentes bacterium]|jgi:putative ABC transport system ATP-binding protein|nr:ATP-binding cassette domain-containing protein [Candidatus Hydrogenedentota bacterium]